MSTVAFGVVIVVTIATIFVCYQYSVRRKEQKHVSKSTRGMIKLASFHNETKLNHTGTKNQSNEAITELMANAFTDEQGTVRSRPTSGCDN